MFVVKVRDQTSSEEHSKGTRKPDLATLQTGGSKRAYYNTGLRHAVKRTSGTGRKPLRLEITGLPGIQPTERSIDLSFQVIGSFSLLSRTQEGPAVSVQLQFGPVRPKNDGRLAGIGSGLFKAEAFDHPVPAAAIVDRQPAFGRVQPQLGGHVHIAQGKETVISDRDSRIFRRTEPDVVAVEITASGIHRGECPEIVVDSR